MGMTREEARNELVLWRNRNSDNGYHYKFVEALTIAIKALEQSRWIPISERLPDLDDYAGSKVWQKKVLITGYLSFDDTKETFVSEAFAKDVIRNTVHNTVVIAWMPLPKPYEPQESEENE